MTQRWQRVPQTRLRAGCGLGMPDDVLGEQLGQGLHVFCSEGLPVRMKTAACGCSLTTLLLSCSVAGEVHSPVMPVLLPAEDQFNSWEVGAMTR
jgi:hypothetical protein